MKYQNLIKFLSYFAEGQNLGERRGGKQADGQVIMPYVAYDEKIGEFIQEFSHSELADHNYVEKMDTRGWWKENVMESAIAEMSAEDVGTCITAIWRRDRFSEGTILRFVKNGILAKLLARLKELDIGFIALVALIVVLLCRHYKNADDSIDWEAVGK